MSPTPLRRAVRRPAAPGPAAALAVLGALVLAGCGPGVGGTGTGNETGGLVSYGAAPSSVCATADFASLLDCAPATGSGTAVVYAADGSPTSRHLARFEGSVLTLDLRCSNLRFVGEWASAGQLGTRYFGNVSPTAGTGSAPPASAIVTSQGNTFVVLVQDFSGRRIGEPMLLQRVQAPTQAGGC